MKFVHIPSNIYCSCDNVMIILPPIHEEIPAKDHVLAMRPMGIWRPALSGIFFLSLRMKNKAGGSVMTADIPVISTV